MKTPINTRAVVILSLCFASAGFTAGRGGMGAVYRARQPALDRLT